MLDEVISLISQRKDLTREQAAQTMRVLMSGEASPVKISALLMGFRVKGETIEEITGFAEVMRDMAVPVLPKRQPLIDIVGTGGDHSGSFNISTTSAFVAAGAGIAVAKHGNRSATSRCGSADVLEALGVNLDAPPERVARCIDEVGIGFLFARSLHTAMKHVAPIRSELRATRTVFNVLGPLTNPARATGLSVGVFDAALVEPLAHVLTNLGAHHAFVSAGNDGLDEISLSGPTRIAEASQGQVNLYEITPEDMGFASVPRSALAGGSPVENAALLRSVLEGTPGPRRDVVLLNAAAGIRAGNDSLDWPAALKVARESIDSGAALRTLDALIKASNDS
ncbi:MAG TPA: anthranilate phosphoribosyltransferase [Candidatus Hydrogenedentes bacterium]|nr:anthranilate phosphoribosyltransferase [Candidatus Hydrogenedentota bacterium]HQM47686.1 anthranilate phosphoribosyltransferase [Candidatus Hydrogenedentota bacterium]